MQVTAYGMEISDEGSSPRIVWSNPGTVQERELCIARLSRHVCEEARNERVTATRVIRLSNGREYREQGAPALDVQWRRTCLRVSHATLPAYSSQAALVDVAGGRVIVVDAEKPFSRSSAGVWCREPELEEYFTKGAKAFWPALRPAAAGEECHYVVKDTTALAVLRLQTQPPTGYQQFPVKLPSAYSAAT